MTEAMILGYSEATEADREAVSAQLGRPVRGMLAVSARLKNGEPAAVLTEPRLPDGSPFPTMYYLTHPELVREASTLEASGEMQQLQQQLQENPELQEAYLAAHRSYLSQRASLAEVEEIADFSAGGMPSRVKCLHALIGHSLSVGPGVNPIGDRAITMLPEWLQQKLSDSYG